MPIKQREYVKLVLKKQKDSWLIFPFVFLYSFLPTLWLAIRVYIINNLASVDFQTYVQLDYLNIFLEIIQQTVIFSLFWWFGKIIIKNDEHMNKVKEIYLLVFVTYFIIIFTISFFVDDLVKLVNPDTIGYEKKIFYAAIMKQCAIYIVAGFNSNFFKFKDVL